MSTQAAANAGTDSGGDDRDNDNVTIVTIAELERRAIALVVRVNSGIIQSPLVGVPMAAGCKPFVTRLDLLLTQTQGIDNIKARFDFSGERITLELTGRFGGSDCRGTHRVKLYDLSGNSAVSFPGTEMRYGIRYGMREWRDRVRESVTAGRIKAEGKAARMLAESLMDSVELASSKRQARVESKCKRIDIEIDKLRRKINRLNESRPSNPLTGRYATQGRECSDYERDRAYDYYLQKAHRKLISMLAAKYSAQISVRANRARGYKRKLTMTVYPWAKFYAELAEYGIKCGYTYTKVHSHKRGPKSPEEYLRDMGQFGLIKNKRDACMYGDSAKGVSEALTRHAEARMKYVGVVNERNSLLSIIEGLEAEMVGLMMDSNGEGEGNDNDIEDIL